MMTCFVLDDEPAAVEILSQYIRDTPYLHLAGSATTVGAAIEALGRAPVDLLFLDIQMPKLTGLQFLDAYAGRCLVVLTTAYSQYALEGYERNVVDYLLKPIPYARFLKAAEKARARHAPPAAPEPPAAPIEEFLLVKTEHKGKLRKINLSDIVYVEGLKNYVSIFTSKREQIVTYIGIGEAQERLPPHLFVRVHRSYIVAIGAIQAIDGNEVLLRDAPRIPTSGRFKEELIARLDRHLLQPRKPGPDRPEGPAD